MKIIHDLEKLYIEGPSAIGIGKFDGLHLGHRKIIEKLTSAGNEDGLVPVVFTFDPPPAVFFGFEENKGIITKNEKRELLEEAGIEVLVEYPMNPVTAAVEPERFIREFLCERMNARLIVAGTDLSFGARGSGNFALLNAMKSGLGYETLEIEKVRMFGNIISSTRIRALLKEGNISEVNALLGRNLRFSGIIKHGRQLGRTIGMPTANIYPDEGKLLPPFGVYYSIMEIDGIDGPVPGISNIGMKPTVKDDEEINIETYLYGVSQELYGREAKVEFLDFKRREMRFPSLEALKETMQKDRESGLEYFKSKGFL